MNKFWFFLLLLCLGHTGIYAQSKSDLKAFPDKFDKTALITRIKNDRRDCERWVLRLKLSEHKDDAKLKSMYAEVRIAYNLLLDEIKEDVAMQKNIASFLAIDLEKRYGLGLEQAATLAFKFCNAAYEKIEGKENEFPAFSPLIKNIWEVLKGFHDKALKKLKEQMKERLDSARFRSWDNIQMED